MDITFTSYANVKEDLLDNYLLVKSIRDFAGNMSNIPLRIYISSDVRLRNEIGKFVGLDVSFTEYPAVDKEMVYAFKPAAALACAADVGEGVVIWLDRHMLVLNPCADLLLNPLEKFAYRPPHLKILGASADEPVNQLWAAAYRGTASILAKIYSKGCQSIVL